MNKSFLYLVIFMVLAAAVMGVGSKVIVLKMGYEQGNISLLNSTVKYGFSPDRRYQPEYGYRLEIISFDEKILDEFRFKAPNEIFVDGTDENGEISGGKVVMDNVNFALSVPYYGDMKEIRVYSPADIAIGTFSFEKEGEVSIIKWALVGLIAIVTVVLIALIIVRNSRK